MNSGQAGRQAFFFSFLHEDITPGVLELLLHENNHRDLRILNDELT
jgi:hypothetical protein